MKIRVKEMRMVKASELEANELNFRRHPPEQSNALDAIIDEVGFAGAVLVRETDAGGYELIDGHLRADVSGDQEIPVIVTDLTQEEAIKVLATYDALGSMAEIDESAFERICKELNFQQESLDKMVSGIMEGFGKYDIDPVAPPELPDGDRNQFQQITFILHDSQADLVSRAIKQAKDSGGGTSTINENSNGNALAYIVETYLGKS
jgi:ParB-like chromosome segregation protein Spo0J